MPIYITCSSIKSTCCDCNFIPFISHLSAPGFTFDQIVSYVFQSPNLNKFLHHFEFTRPLNNNLLLRKKLHFFNFTFSFWPQDETPTDVILRSSKPVTRKKLLSLRIEVRISLCSRQTVQEHPTPLRTSCFSPACISLGKHFGSTDLRLTCHFIPSFPLSADFASPNPHPPSSTLLLTPLQKRLTKLRKKSHMCACVSACVQARGSNLCMRGFYLGCLSPATCKDGTASRSVL